MSSSFDLHPDRFLTGTVGEPGQRVFYLQAAEEDRTVSFRLEKQQVAALAEYLAGILADLPPDEEPPLQTLTLVEPIVAEWTVGSLAVAYDADEDTIIVVAEELTETGPDDEPLDDLLGEAGSARFHLRRGQVTAFIRVAVELVMSGRPPCPLCGQPLDPDGHVCPRSNGHGKH